MQKNLNLVQTLLKEAKKIEKIELGLSNDNYLIQTRYNEKLVYRQARNNDLFNRFEEANISYALALYNIDVPLVYLDPRNGDKITVFVKGFHKTDFELDDMKKVAILLKKLHSLPIKTKNEFNPLLKYQQYLKEVKSLPKELTIYQDLINKFDQYYQKADKVLCHNDIVYGNLLFTNDHVYLIDYEYAGINDPMFDLCSFTSENNIEDQSLIRQLLVSYFGELNDEILTKFNIYYSFADLLWSLWAYLYYQRANKQVYFDIYQLKVTRLKKRWG